MSYGFALLCVAVATGLRGLLVPVLGYRVPFSLYFPASIAGTYDAFLQLVHPEDRPGLEAAIRDALQGGVEYDIEFRVPWKDGSIHWMNGRGHVEVEDGKPVRMIGLGIDITERRRSEAAHCYRGSSIRSGVDRRSATGRRRASASVSSSRARSSRRMAGSACSRGKKRRAFA